MSADRDITPRVIAHIRAELPTIERSRRASPLVAQVVLRQLARWARPTPTPGVWTSTETLDQIVAGTGIPSGTVRKALDCLTRLDLVSTVKRGGGRGLSGRGSTRTLSLDPVDNTQTARAKRAQFNPKLRALDTETPRANAQTARAQEPNTVFSSSVSYSSACSRCEDGWITEADERGRRFAAACPECSTVTR